MKQTLLSLSLLLGFAGSVQAQNPCGLTLTKTGTGLTRTYTASSTATGALYNIVSYGNSGTPYGNSNTGTLTVTYPSAGIYNVFTYTYNNACSDSVFIYDTVAAAPLPAINSLNMYIYLNSSTVDTSYVPQVKTYLIKKDNAAGTLTAVDSVVTAMGTSCRCYTNASFSGMLSGTYRTKSYIVNQPGNTPISWLPTYSDSTAYWNTADTFVFTGNTSLSKSTHMLSGTPTSGPGFIGGLISAGANKGTAEGDPVAGIDVYLRNAAGKVIQVATTNALGKYSFLNVGTGSYSLYPEELNFHNAGAVSIVVSATQTNQDKSFNFKRNAGDREYIPNITLGVNSLDAQRFVIAPNPTSSIIRISLHKGNDKVLATLSNAMGQVVLQEQFTGSSTSLNVSQLPAGMYQLQLQAGTEIHTEKVQITH